MNIKQYRDAIKLFFSQHVQINTVKSGNQFVFNAKSDIVYRIAHVEYIRQRTTDTEKSYDFIITVADIFDVNQPDSEEDIISDCSQICQDVLDYFSNQIGAVYTVRENVNIDPWSNGHKDRARGAIFTLTFTETRTANDCEIPINI